MMEMCRLCLLALNGSICHEIFDGDSDMVLKIITCLPLQFSKKDNLPSKICKPCFNKVNRFYNFRMKVMESDKKLKKSKSDYKDSKNYVNGEFQSIKEEQSYGETFKSECKYETTILKISIATQTDEVSEFTLLSNKDDIKSESENNVEHNRIDVEYNFPLKPDDDYLSDGNFSDEVIPNDFCDDSDDSEYQIPTKRGKVKNVRLKNTNKSLEKDSVESKDRVFKTSNSDYINSNNTKHANKEKSIYRTRAKSKNMDDKFESKNKKVLNNDDENGDPSIDEDNICDSNWFCCVCFKKFPEKADLMLHYKSHRQIGYTVICKEKRKKVIKCKFCNETYTTVKAVTTHGRKSHNFKSFKCSLCEKDIISIFEILQHGQKEHANGVLSDFSLNEIKDVTPKPSTKRFMCDICDETFFYPRYVMSHRKEMHPESQYMKFVYRCMYCKSHFGYLYGLKRHLNVHTKDIQYLCKTCGKSFLKYDTLKSHESIHTGIRPYKCEICNRAFVEKKHYKTHQLVHTQKRSHVCTHCGMAFVWKTTLIMHERQHTETESYICNFCNKSFLLKSQLTTHLKYCVDQNC